MSETGISTSVRRKEVRRFLMGNSNYLDNINVEVQTYAYVARSEHTRATINEIDAGAAEASDGVFPILTGKDISAT
jgi:CO/xanthine dehydrogenase Mo-binding subunit